MPFRFKLELTRVECLNEQLNEWGKDEMRLFGFGITRKGHLFATGLVNLGSYHTGDVNKSSFPKTLFERELEDDGQEVVFFAWLIEEDSGGVRDRAAALEEEFRNSFAQQVGQLFQAQFPRECIPFTAFYKAVLPFEASLKKAATKRRNDQVYSPFDLVLHNEPSDVSSVPSSKELTLRSSKHLGDYQVTVRQSYEQQLVIHPG